MTECYFGNPMFFMNSTFPFRPLRSLFLLYIPFHPSNSRCLFAFPNHCALYPIPSVVLIGIGYFPSLQIISNCRQALLWLRTGILRGIVFLVNKYTCSIILLAIVLLHALILIIFFVCHISRDFFA